MIVNAAGTFALSNFRWVDAGRLWSYKLGQPDSKLVYVSDANWLTLVEGADDHFAVVHHFDDGGVKLTSHSSRNFPETISSVELQFADNTSRGIPTVVPEFKGQMSAWSFLPKAYVIEHLQENYLFLLDWMHGTAEVQSLPWYTSSYDLMYQGILGVTEVPGSSLLIFSIQRDSEPVIYNPSTRTVTKKLKLGGDSGAPQLFFRRNAPELWASDYDTLVSLDSREWGILNRVKLEEGHSGMARSNIGKYCFTPDESLCLLARPHSGDVVGIDPNTFTVTRRIETGGQPEDVGLFHGGLVIARELGTGRLLQGTF